jgi:tetratricopeptide (TPR) repeat protein
VYNLGLACKLSGKFSSAINYFTKAIEIDHDDILAFFHRGECYLLRDAIGDIELGIQDATMAMQDASDKIYPDAARLRNDLFGLLNR